MLADSLIKRFLPRSLLGRSLLIIVTPLVLVQVVAALVFFESHWDKVTLRLARGLAGDIAVLATLLREDPTEAGVVRMVRIAADHMQIGGPIFSPGRSHIWPARRGQVIRQRIHPHIHDVPRRIRHRNAPVKCGPRNGQVL